MSLYYVISLVSFLFYPAIGFSGNSSYSHSGTECLNGNGVSCNKLEMGCLSEKAEACFQIAMVRIQQNHNEDASLFMASACRFGKKLACGQGIELRRLRNQQAELELQRQQQDDARFIQMMQFRQESARQSNAIMQQAIQNITAPKKKGVHCTTRPNGSYKVITDCE